MPSPISASSCSFFNPGICSILHPFAGACATRLGLPSGSLFFAPFFDVPRGAHHCCSGTCADRPRQWSRNCTRRRRNAAGGFRAPVFRRPSPSSSSRPSRAGRLRRTASSDSDSLMSASTRQIICSETAIGRPPSMVAQHPPSRFLAPFLFDINCVCIEPFLHLVISRISRASRPASRRACSVEPDPVLAPHELRVQIFTRSSGAAFKLVNVAGVRADAVRRAASAAIESRSRRPPQTR